jgi:hypothetical protein
MLRLHGHLGPVLGGDGKDCNVVIGTESESPASAAGELYGAVCDGLRAAKLGHLYPTTVEVEPATL